jgi:hypothetical protein
VEGHRDCSVKYPRRRILAAGIQLHWRNLMEPRDRDKLNKNNGSTKGSELDSKSDIGRNKSDSKADFGQNVGQPGQINDPTGRSGKQGLSGVKGSDKSGSSLDEENVKGKSY